MTDHRALSALIIDVCVAAGAGRMHNRERWIDTEAVLREQLFSDVATAEGGTLPTLLGGWVRRTGLGAGSTMEEEYGGELRTGRQHTFEITLLRDMIDAQDTASAHQDLVDAVADAFESEEVRMQFIELGYTLTPIRAQIADATYNALRSVHRAVLTITCTGVAG